MLKHILFLCSRLKNIRKVIVEHNITEEFLQFESQKLSEIKPQFHSQFHW